MECWGGATFDVAMRFLQEDPWQRLAQLRERDAEPAAADAAALGERGRLHELSRQRRALLRQARRRRAASTCSASSTRSTGSRTCAWRSTRCSRRGKLCEAAICYTGNLSDPHEKKYTLDYYLKLARELKAAGTHVLGVKDMAGLCRPRAAHALVKALKEEIGLPVHFHTHDTSGIAAASVLAAIEAGADAVDGAMDSMSGLTSQPNLGSIVEALRYGPRDTGIDPARCACCLAYWEQARRAVRRVRERHPLRHVRGLRARHAGRPVHEPARAGALARNRRCALARSRADLRRRERDVRRHREGDADLESRRRHGAADGHERPDAASRCSIRRPRSRFRNRSCSCSAAISASPTAASRRRCRSKILKGAKPLTERPGAHAAAGGSRRRAGQDPAEAAAAGRPTTISLRI